MESEKAPIRRAGPASVPPPFSSKDLGYTRRCTRCIFLSHQVQNSNRVVGHMGKSHLHHHATGWLIHFLKIFGKWLFMSQFDKDRVTC